MISLKEKYMTELVVQVQRDAILRDQNHIISASQNSKEFSVESTTSQQSTLLPTWMTKMHVFLIALIVAIAIALVLFWSIWPYVKQKNLSFVNHMSTEKNKTYHPSTGFRTAVLICSSAINGILLLSPYIAWYLKSWKIIDYSQKELPMSQRSLYYSYSINEGAGQKIASVGVGISNMLWTLIIIFRFQFYKARELTFSESTDFNVNSAIACMFLGLLSRMFMAAVPSFPVHSHPVSHYFFASMMFISTATYMLLETYAVDPSVTDDLRAYHEAEFIFRRISSLTYCLGIIIMMVFMKLELWAFSSIGELLSLIASELYILTYITSFKLLDEYRPFLSFTNC